MGEHRSRLDRYAKFRKRVLRDRGQEVRRALRSVRFDLLIRERDTVHSIPG